ncbi:MAG: DUF4252 domain-containing protein [Ignavibacteriaceae bacterium]
MKKLMGLFLTIILFSAFTAYPQDKTDYSKFPGYVDFGSMSKFMSGDNVTEINLDANLLKMLSKMGAEKNKDFQEVVGGLKLIKVNSFGLDAANEQEVKDKVSAIDQSLMSKNWQRIIKVKEHGEYTNVYVLPSNDYENFLGLCVTSIDAKGKKDKGKPEATFVNIVGNINMSQLGKLGDKFNIPALEIMKKDKGEKEKSDKK